MNILITGASQGIGAAIATRLAHLPDANLLLVARNERSLSEVARTCLAAGALGAEVFPTDLTQRTDVDRLAHQITRQWGTPDVVVNNAGVFVPKPIVDTDDETFRHQIDMNLTSAFMISRAFLPGMYQRQSGYMIYIASIASVQAHNGAAAYVASKHGLLGLARSARDEAKDKGVKVTTILPGATLTPSWDGVDIDAERLMRPEDVAETVAYCLTLSPQTCPEEILLRPQLGDL
ncbi:MAG: SDR family oxidoreductase [Bacteroidetes bacterium]|jgi:short-subunit dehydrogenase|nr:SDR family oxidoreductase [Bacteroidota bacterium]